jgi:ribosomal protein S8
MLRASRPITLAKLYNVPWSHKNTDRGHLGTSLRNYKDKERAGMINTHYGASELPLRQALQTFAAEPESRRRLSNLPGVEFESELPADPITRLFFQRKGDEALYEGENDTPNLVDHDRLMLAHRDGGVHKGRGASEIFDFCHRIREGHQTRKRFVIVPADGETKGISEIMMRHGLIAGYRDFNNDRAYAVELKYFQGESVIQGLEPVSRDVSIEFEFTPKMMRRFMSSFGITNKVRIFVVKTWDGRVIDHIEAVNEGISGRGLVLVW